MTTMTIEYTEAEIAHRKACAYLKGYIVAASNAEQSKRPRTPEFEEGCADARGYTPNSVTLAHILHNRLRHNRPHRASGKHHHDAGYTDYDQSHIDYMRSNSTYFTNMLIGKLATYGINVNTLLMKEA